MALSVWQHRMKQNLRWIRERSLLALNSNVIMAIKDCIWLQNRQRQRYKYSDRCPTWQPWSFSAIPDAVISRLESNAWPLWLIRREVKWYKSASGFQQWHRSRNLLQWNLELTWKFSFASCSRVFCLAGDSRSPSPPLPSPDGCALRFRMFLVFPKILYLRRTEPGPDVHRASYPVLFFPPV